MAAADMFAGGKRKVDVVAKLGVSAQTASRWHRRGCPRGGTALVCGTDSVTGASASADVALAPIRSVIRSRRPRALLSDSRVLRERARASPLGRRRGTRLYALRGNRCDTRSQSRSGSTGRDRPVQRPTRLTDAARPVRIPLNGRLAFAGPFLEFPLERLLMSDGVWGRVHRDLPGRRGTR